jgi:anti-sigma28 factor (negative regulator of flagellin synthesis)
MIISRAEIRSAVAAYKTVKRQPSVDTLAFDTADSFDRSDLATAMAEFAHVAAVSEPFYRKDLVDDLGRRITEGRYFVPSEEIVDKLLGRLIVEAATA